jgi:hypothetical protein
MTTEIQTLKIQADEASFRYALGEISRDEAKHRIAPYLQAANARGKEIAKKHGRRHAEITFTSFTR